MDADSQLRHAVIHIKRQMGGQTDRHADRVMQKDSVMQTDRVMQTESICSFFVVPVVVHVTPMRLISAFYFTQQALGGRVNRQTD